MRRERPRDGAAGDRLHHRRLDFEIAALRHELADGRDDPAPGLEHFAGRRVHDQVQIPLAVPDLDIREAVPFLRQRREALDEKVHARRPDGKLVRLRAEQPAFNANEVAEVERLENLEVEFRNGVLPHVDLNRLQTVGEHKKVRLAERPHPENASAGGRWNLVRVELVMRPLAIGGRQFRNRVRAIETARIDFHAERHELVEVRTPLLDLFFERGH